MAAIVNLFPEFNDLPTSRQQRQYVRRRLVEMATDGTLYLTDCLAHPEPIRTYVGDAILGYDVSASGDHRAGRPVPQELLDYRVHLVALPHMVQEDTECGDGTTRSRYVEQTTPIRFKYGSIARDDGQDYDAAKARGEAWAAVEWYEPNWVDTGKTDVMLPLQQAQWCLRQCGENVKKAKSRRLQRRFWHCREVRPGEDAEKAKTRPRKRRDAEEAPNA